jgi:hypothetical protein
MARFYDAIGYDHGQVETVPGVWESDIVEKKLYGNIVRDMRQARDGEYLNNDITVQNLISVVADAYANENYHAIKYAVWNGVRWIVESVEVQRPRLILRLGRRYNGPIPPPTP